VWIDLARVDPAELAARFRSRRSIDCSGPKHVYEEVKAAGGRAPHLVEGHGPQVNGAIARLFEELSPCRILETLVPLDVPAGEEPRAGERTRGLLNDQDASRAVDARDDRADPRPLGHPRYGFFVGVGTGTGVVGKGGSVAGGNVTVGLVPGVRVGTGVSTGASVGHGSELTRFQV
jgi:hypothetical protein